MREMGGEALLPGAHPLTHGDIVPAAEAGAGVVGVGDPLPGIPPYSQERTHLLWGEWCRAHGRILSIHRRQRLGRRQW